MPVGKRVAKIGKRGQLSNEVIGQWGNKTIWKFENLRIWKLPRPSVALAKAGFAPVCLSTPLRQNVHQCRLCGLPACADKDPQSRRN